MENKIPASIHAECSACKSETLHRTLKGKFSGKKKLDMVLKCSECGHVHEERLELAGRTTVRLIISRGKESEKARIELPSDWVLSVGDELMHGDERLLITGIEVDRRRVDSAKIDTLETLWTRNFDVVRVRVAVNRRGRTKSLEIIADPDEEFEVGTEIEIDGRPVLIHSVKTAERKVRRGTATARDIVRMYCTDRRPRRSGRRPGGRS